MEMSKSTSQKNIYLYSISSHDDFRREREILYREVLPDLTAWCEWRFLHLIHTQLQWGEFMDQSLLNKCERTLQSRIADGEIVIFLDITCGSLGIISSNGAMPDQTLLELQKCLHITDVEMRLLQQANPKKKPCVLELVRDPSFMSDLLPEEMHHFLSTAKIPKSFLMHSRNLLQSFPEQQIVHYAYDRAGVDLDAGQLIVDVESSFTTKVLHLLKETITELSLDETGTCSSQFMTEDARKQAHFRYMLTMSQQVKGRQDTLHQIKSYIEGGSGESSQAPLLLLGGAGSGKSAIMAKAVYDICQQSPKVREDAGVSEAPGVIYHFTGVSSESNDISLILKQILQELHVTRELSTVQASLAQLSCSVLSSDSCKPIVLFIDAIDRCLDDPSQVMTWLPWELPPQVRCIISLTNDCEQHRLLQQREIPPQQLHLTPLDVTATQSIIMDHFAGHSCPLISSQIQQLLCKKSSENPLWLSLACHLLVGCDTPDEINALLVSLPETLLELVMEVLRVLEEEVGTSLFMPAVCLLVTSSTGLKEEELRAILGQAPLQPASPYEEKDEQESLEKDEGKEKKSSGPLASGKWEKVYRALRPHLQPREDWENSECKLSFYHNVFNTAVRKKYMQDADCEDEGQYICEYWHMQLADFFQSETTNMDRKAEEYLYHLSKLGDEARLSQCLADWDMLDKLHGEENSTRLLAYWRQAGGTEVMVEKYKEALGQLEEADGHNDRQIALRYEHIAHIFLQAGSYQESLELTTAAIKWEEKELGNRPERMVELYSLMAEIYDEKLKLNDFVSTSQLPDLRRTITYGRKSISLRKQLPEPHHKHKLAVSLMKLAFSLESWEACGGDTEMSGAEAIEEGNKHIDTALQIFDALHDKGHYAEALMTKGVLAKRGSNDQLQYYEKAMDICRQVYGDYSLLTSRLYINMGIVYEDNKDYVKAFAFFRKWGQVSERVLGPDHPKTQRAKGVLCEARYRRVAECLKEREQQIGGEDDENNVVSVEEINRQVEVLQEDLVRDAVAMENREMEEHEGELIQVTEELQHAINSILQRAIGELELSDELQIQAQNILNMVENRLGEDDSDGGSDDSVAEEELVDEDAERRDTEAASNADCNVRSEDAHIEGDASVVQENVVDSNVLAEARCNESTEESDR